MFIAPLVVSVLACTQDFEAPFAQTGDAGPNPDASATGGSAGKAGAGGTGGNAGTGGKGGNAGTGGKGGNAGTGGKGDTSEYEYWEEPDPSPYLANVGAPPPCDYIIDSTSKFGQVNDPSYRVFCIVPGAYDDALFIDSSGTAESPRWLRYYDPSSEVGENVHPYHMTDASRAKLRHVYLYQANYWVIDRLSVSIQSCPLGSHARRV